MITAPNTTYAYNALGQRTGKTVGGVATGFAYGTDGQLLYETSGGNSKAYVYLNGRPLARIDNNSAIYYYHTDRLGTPQVMTDSAGTVVWKADYEPFGKAAIRTQTVVNNLRLPGQYFDAETGMHYNYFRDYDPGTGRYVTSDPIGLEGGLNTYIYVYANPLKFIDPEGLQVRLICRPVSNTGRNHCFVYVTCPKEGWSRILSLFGNTNVYPPFTTGSKAWASPATPNFPDDPNSPNNNYDQTVNSPSSCDKDQCKYEKEVIDRFLNFPQTVPYFFFGPNSNSFAQHILGGHFPGLVPPNAPGFGYGW